LEKGGSGEREESIFWGGKRRKGGGRHLHKHRQKTTHKLALAERGEKEKKEHLGGTKKKGVPGKRVDHGRKGFLPLYAEASTLTASSPLEHQKKKRSLEGGGREGGKPRGGLLSTGRFVSLHVVAQLGTKTVETKPGRRQRKEASLRQEADAEPQKGRCLLGKEMGVALGNVPI